MKVALKEKKKRLFKKGIFAFAKDIKNQAQREHTYVLGVRRDFSDVICNFFGISL